MFTQLLNQLRRAAAAITRGTAALGLAAVLALGAVASNDAEAKRVGGGQSVGRQSQTASPSGQGQSGQQAQAQTSQQAAQPAATSANRWMGPLAGLAAGFGIAALLSSFGLAEELAQMLANTLLIGLVVVAAVMLFRFITRRRRPDLAYGHGAANRQQANGSLFSNPLGQPRPEANPRNWPHAVTDSINTAKVSDHLPKVDQAVFLGFAKSMFVRLQGAWDRNEQGDLFELTTPQMFAQIKQDLEARGGQPSVTEVTQLDAEVLGEENSANETLVSVRFYGQMREDHAQNAQPFQEIWNLVRSVHGDQSWRLAGIQQIDR
ncbi:Tim44 domain-containing protein [Paraburkholderia sp. ZP32-5]|uniref:Tim44 domain-containing protein n=1 Tax=Paraburkholderia sp. ZP32-5 TaxID=2883245 RepID=UPI001F2EED38|nr:TIM44-like domain-containing protein [Paraburkholderia sp. ZP32-5]